MKPLRLVFSAFGPYARQQVLDFQDLKGRNFFLIHGPTGAGKTTILDAICFALYGDSSGNLRDGKTMRSDHAGLTTLTEVEFTFAIGSSIYKVWRSPEQERAKKRGDGTTISLADAVIYELNGDAEKLLVHGYSNVTVKVEELLGFKSSQFRQVVLLPQGEFRKLLLANSLQRQEIMQTLFKTDLYKRIEENLKQQAKEIKQERENLLTKNNFILQELKLESVEALEQALQAELLLQKANADKVKLLEMSRQKAQQTVANGKVIQSKFENLAMAKLENEKCEKLLPTVEEYKIVYQKAQAAMQLLDIENQVNTLNNDCDKNQQQLIVLTAQADKIAEQVKQAEIVLKQEQAKETMRESVNRQLIELAALSNKANLLSDAIKDGQEKAKLVEAKVKLKMQGETALIQLQSKLKDLREKLQKSTIEAAKADNYKLESSKWQELQSKLTLKTKIGAEAKTAQSNLAKATEQLKLANSAYETQKSNLLRLQYLFTEGQTAVLAKTLVDNEPCPVCGSLNHPNPAMGQDILPDVAEVKQAQIKLDLMEKQRQTAQSILAKCQTDYDTIANRQQDIEATIGDNNLNLVMVKQKIAILQESLAKAIAFSEEAKKIQLSIVNLEREEQNLTVKQQVLLKDYQNADNAWQAALAIQKERSEALPEKYRDLEFLLKEQATLKATQQKLKQSLELAQHNWQQINNEQAVSKTNLTNINASLEKAKARYQAAQTTFNERLLIAGFGNLAEYNLAKKTPEYMKNLAERIKIFDERIITAKNALKLASETTKLLQMPDLAKLEEITKAKEKEYNEAFADLCRQKDSIKIKQEKQVQLKALATKLQQINEQYAVSGTLAEVANGNNSYGMTFQRFVLKSLLDDVIDASNLRLKIMSRGQYILQSTDDRARKNAAGGLEIEIFDHYTGYARPVSTLSGGETFLASLALALGLADVVQSYAGGIHLDTILVDEGFGTLDPESLDIAIKALVDLQKGGRLVGIISHVPELKERIDARLEVTKGKSGSSAKFCVS